MLYQNEKSAQNTEIHSALSDVFLSFSLECLFSSLLVDDIAIATASQWQMRRHNKTRRQTQPRELAECMTASTLRLLTDTTASPSCDLSQSRSSFFPVQHPDVTGSASSSHVRVPFWPGNALLLLRNRPVGWQLTNVPPSWQTLLLCCCFVQII